jgi:hypothetical protein
MYDGVVKAPAKKSCRLVGAMDVIAKKASRLKGDA